jgi:hypothetical protein
MNTPVELEAALLQAVSETEDADARERNPTRLAILVSPRLPHPWRSNAPKKSHVAQPLARLLRARLIEVEKDGTGARLGFKLTVRLGSQHHV